LANPRYAPRPKKGHDVTNRQRKHTDGAHPGGSHCRDAQRVRGKKRVSEKQVYFGVQKRGRRAPPLGDENPRSAGTNDGRRSETRKKRGFWNA